MKRETLGQVQCAYGEARMQNDNYAAGVYAYALALYTKAQRQLDLAHEYAADAIRFLVKAPANTLAECTPDDQYILGIPIPDIFHIDVARKRLVGLI